MKRLIVGPWIGEFGWEVMCWQGYARTRAQHYDHVVCISRTGHEYLYEDFCHEYVRHDPVTFDASGASAKGDYDTSIHRTHLVGDADWMAPRTYHCNRFPPRRWQEGRGSMYVDGHEIEQTFRRFGISEPQLGYDLVVHSRNLPERQWSKQSLEEVVQHCLDIGFRIACVGSPRESFSIEGCDDLRGVPLRRLANVLASSAAVLGSSSGPLHFASLCGCPQIVVSKQGNRYRYETAWNPFRTRVVLIEDEGWNPSSDHVIAKLHEFFEDFRATRRASVRSRT